MVKKTKQTSETLSQYTKKTEFWLGLATIFVVAAIGGVFAFRNVGTTTPKKADTALVTSISPTQAAITPKPTATLKKVTKLANTSGVYTETVLEGDNFWKISVRACGIGNYYRSIQAYNGYTDVDTLHSGDVLTIVCQE